LVKQQHGLITRSQLLRLGYGPEAIRHRLAVGRLHQIHTDVYAVGRPRLTQHGAWLAAVLTCGPHAVLSHGSAAALWGIRPARKGAIEVSVPVALTPRRKGIVVHRRKALGPEDVMRHQGIPLTSPICTLIDIAAKLETELVEAAVNEADRLDLADPEQLRAALDRTSPRPGTRALREIIDRRTFTLTDSELERTMLKLAYEIGLSKPGTGVWLHGFKVDFYWPELGLVIETDGLRYHRTPAQQTRDRVRDQVLTAAGLTPLRFTRAQVKFDRHHVRSVLGEVVRRLTAAR
jgi:very-short-patch-repair endonuclease